MNEMGGEVVVALVDSGKSWLVVTLANFMPALWTLTLIFHFGRPYIMRVLRTLSLRFGADVWWLSYVLIRDALMVVTFAVGTILLMPGLFISETFPILAPISALLFFCALVIKLFGDADDDARTFRAVSLLLVTGATVYFVPLFFGVQALEQEYLGELPELLVSSTNQALAGPVLIVGLIGYGLIGLYIFTRFTLALRRPSVQPGEELAGQSR